MYHMKMFLLQWTPTRLHIGTTTALHSDLTHLETKDSHVRMLFDFSSPFNTINPQQLILKLVQQGLNSFLCNLAA